MTTFDDRDKGFENKYAHDEETAFKATALRNRLLGEWAAAKMGKTDIDAKRYADSVVEAEFGANGHAALEAKLLEDLTKAGVSITLKEIQKEAERLLPVAQKQIRGVSE